MKRIWFEPFGKSTGINVSTTSIPDMSKLEVMEKVGNVEWDLVDTEGVQMQIAIKKGLLQPIDYDLIFSIVPKEQIDPKVITKYGIGSVAFSTVIAWNHDLFGAAGPQTWAEWFDTTRFKGRRALYAQPRPSFEIALMAAGVPKDKIYPINIDDAFKALDAIRSKVNLWVEKTSQWAVLMQNGEVDLMGSSLARTLEERNVPARSTFPSTSRSSSSPTGPFRSRRPAGRVSEADRLDDAGGRHAEICLGPAVQRRQHVDLRKHPEGHAGSAARLPGKRRQEHAYR
ncbi:extracellular solute-binding protein (plasmid) [Neorhizobium galegae]|nr:extracellular solute-binding protein [Neorhizobium galegae]